MLIVFSCSIFSSLVTATDSILITNQSGVPIENVVITIPSLKIEEKPNELAVMDQVNMQFLPHVLTVNKGQSVSFPNSDNIRHHIYSFSKAKPFEFKMFSGGESKHLTFEQAGLVVLGCNIHDQMLGYIYVTDNQYTTITNEKGVAILPQSGLAISLWHPNLSTNKSERINIQLPSTFTTSPFKIVLELEAIVAPPPTNTFKSKKFNKGN